MNVLKKGAKTDNFKIKRMSDNLYILKIDDYNDYKKTLDVLQNTNTQYYTYTPRQEKCKSFLLKGLDSSYELKEVMEIINNMEIPNLVINKGQNENSKLYCTLCFEYGHPATFR
ncbi:hypothetical protein PV328_004319 [Microctonus aethiopoides]|uniref:Uncharacterized protein n=1 Tax=Microctonus aethiopoides TaxID=144406 RepID=A0AA39KLG2_9HYME|nr:hypothetical protein PV328_004319 [Microctonus aethiopoides]